MALRVGACPSASRTTCPRFSLKIGRLPASHHDLPALSTASLKPFVFQPTGEATWAAKRQRSFSPSNASIHRCLSAEMYPSPAGPCHAITYQVLNRLTHVASQGIHSSGLKASLGTVSRLPLFHLDTAPPYRVTMQAMASGSNVTGQTESTDNFSFSFPHICPAAQTMMADLLGTLETELGSELLPSATPEDVRSFQSPNGNAEGSVVLRAGRDRSHIDRMLVSSLHCALPFGTLDFATLTVLMGPATDAPHLLFEFPFSGTTKVTTVMDLLPRKDLVLNVEYLKRFYESTPLVTLHKQCEEDPRMERYVPPSLYIRCATSPTACLYTVDPSHWPSAGEQKDQINGRDGSTGSSGAAPLPTLDEAVREVVHPKAKEAMLAWISAVKEHARVVPEGDERRQLAERDAVLLANGIEWDLTSNLPRLFGQEVTDRVLDAFRKGA